MPKTLFATAAALCASIPLNLAQASSYDPCNANWTDAPNTPRTIVARCEGVVGDIGTPAQSVDPRTKLCLFRATLPWAPKERAYLTGLTFTSGQITNLPLEVEIDASYEAVPFLLPARAAFEESADGMTLYSRSSKGIPGLPGFWLAEHQAIYNATESTLEVAYRNKEGLPLGPWMYHFKLKCQ